MVKNDLLHAGGLAGPCRLVPRTIAALWALLFLGEKSTYCKKWILDIAIQQRDLIHAGGPVYQIRFGRNNGRSTALPTSEGRPLEERCGMEKR
jgi:hypothetical protein